MAIIKRRQAYKFRLLPTKEQANMFLQFAGCCRFVYNWGLGLEKQEFENTGKRLGYNNIAKLLTELKKEKMFLKEVYSQILQQSLKDLDRAYQNFFAKRASLPKFKKRGCKDSFRYPQPKTSVKLEEGNKRIYLPKIGWIRYKRHQQIAGEIKNVTVSLTAGKWYVSIQTERDVPKPVHNSKSKVGLDLGVVNLATLSNQDIIQALDFKRYERKIARLQRRLARKVKHSKNSLKLHKKIQTLYLKISNIRKDYLHKMTTNIAKNHGVVCVEDLLIKNMSKSAKGSLENPGKNVKSKSGLNRAILSQGWGEFLRQLEYKLDWLGGQLIKVDPKNTSRKCSRCGYIDKDNRKNQAHFCCKSCGLELNADFNAALNILAAGLAVIACGEEKAPASSRKQETALT